MSAAIAPAVEARRPRRGSVRGQLRDVAIAIAIALIAFTAAFAAHRVAGLTERQLELARRARDTGLIAPGTTVAWVSPPAPARHAFLEHRTVRELDERGQLGPERRLGGATAPAMDKLFADAAREVERGGARLARLVDDGDGRAMAAGPAAQRGTWVALTAAATPEPYPWLVVIGLLGLALAIGAAGGLVGGPFRAPAVFVAGSALAVPPLIWGQLVAAAVIAIVAAIIALGTASGTSDRIASGFRRHRVALAFLAPTAIAMLVLVATPFVIGLVIGFYDHHHGTWEYVGLDNFAEILSGGGHALSDPLNFWFVLGVTVLWTFANVVLHVTIGVALALLLSRTWLRGKGVWRMLLILPWAIPNYITALIWHGMFEGEHGALNSLLDALGLDTVSWFTSWATAFSANVVTNTWLGFPFMMVVALGAIQSIPRDLYEAAEVDGASSWQRFVHITLPHLRPAMAPAIALGSIWTFNMFNVIFLVSAGEPSGSTNILVTDAYRWAFERGERYGMAAAYATIIFLILLLWTVFGTRVVRREEPA